LRTKQQTDPRKLYVLELAPGAGAVAPPQKLLTEADPQFVCWEDENTGAVRFERYCGTPAEAKRVRARVERLLRGAGLARVSGRIRVRVLPARDWAEAWKEFFHVQRVSPRIVVKPSWEDHDPLPGDCVVEIDPGMCFGTGQHATTRACLVFLDGAASGLEGGSFLDLGCGSGILSIAAVKLGFRKAVALDNDPAAVECAGANAAANGVGDRVECVRADLSTWRPPGRFDVVAANILAPVLAGNSARIAGLLSKRNGSRLIVAGILSSQYATVLRAYAAQGFVEFRRAEEGEWASGLLVRAKLRSDCRRPRPTTSASKWQSARRLSRSSGCPGP
jgi:ribosomal protein L11 methyltransferase